MRDVRREGLGGGGGGRVWEGEGKIGEMRRRGVGRKRCGEEEEQRVRGWERERGNEEETRGGKGRGRACQRVGGKWGEGGGRRFEKSTKAIIKRYTEVGEYIYIYILFFLN